MIKCVSTVFSGSWDTISVESGPVLVTTLASVHAPATHYNTLTPAPGYCVYLNCVTAQSCCYSQLRRPRLRCSASRNWHRIRSHDSKHSAG